MIRTIEQACHRVVWGEHELFVLHASWHEGGRMRAYEWVVGRAEAPLRDFVLDVARKTHSATAAKK